MNTRAYISFINGLNKMNVLLIIHSTTSTTDTSTTDSTRLTNEMVTSSDYLMKYFNGFLAVLLDQRTFCLRRKNPSK